MSRLKEIEKQIKELELERDELMKPEPMFGQALSHSSRQDFYFLDCRGGSIPEFTSINEIKRGLVFLTEEYALLEDRKRILKQEARVAMAESWGDERPDFDQRNWYVYTGVGGVRTIYIHAPTPLCFRTQEYAKQFADKYTVEEIQMMLEL